MRAFHPYAVALVLAFCSAASHRSSRPSGAGAALERPYNAFLRARREACDEMTTQLPGGRLRGVTRAVQDSSALRLTRHHKNWIGSERRRICPGRYR
eukprot:scaffold37605_cov62-Phaeocystis_antarctica.AAC.12